MHIKLSIELTIENGKLPTLPSEKSAQTTAQRTITRWPYWCWNCKHRIETKPIKMECPYCGVSIPEP